MQRATHIMPTSTSSVQLAVLPYFGSESWRLLSSPLGVQHLDAFAGKVKQTGRQSSAEVVYVSECMARVYVERARFLCSSWNVVDLTTVLLGCLQLALADTVNLSLLRLSRIARVLSLGAR